MTKIILIENRFDMYFYLRALKQQLIIKHNIFIVFSLSNQTMNQLPFFIRLFRENILIFKNNNFRYGNINIISNFLEYIKIVKRLNKLNKDSTLLLNNKTSLISNLLLNKFSNHKLFQFYKEDTINFDYKSTIFNFYPFIYGLSKIKVKKNNQKEIAMKIQLEKKLNTIYLQQLENQTNSFIFKTLDFRHSNKILIFGSRFLDWKHTDEKLIKKIKIFYNSFFFKYKNNIFYYLPHPRESNKELKFIENLAKKQKLIINKPKNQISAEYFLLKIKELNFCISIGSTSSMQAYLMGFRSYIFYEILKFSKDINAEFEAIHKFCIKKNQNYSLKNIDQIEDQFILNKNDQNYII